MSNENKRDIARFSPLSLQLLEESGWYSGRDIFDMLILPSQFQVFPAAITVLREFGNLKVGQSGRGITCARTEVVFDPMAADGEEDRFSDWSKVINSQLYPLGTIVDEHLFLAIDERGRTFCLIDIMGFLDTNFDRALDMLLTGIEGTPIEVEEDIPSENQH